MGKEYSFILFQSELVVSDIDGKEVFRVTKDRALKKILFFSGIRDENLLVLKKKFIWKLKIRLKKEDYQILLKWMTYESKEFRQHYHRRYSIPLLLIIVLFFIQKYLLPLPPGMEPVETDTTIILDWISVFFTVCIFAVKTISLFSIKAELFLYNIFFMLLFILFDASLLYLQNMHLFAVLDFFLLIPLVKEYRIYKLFSKT